MKAEWSSVRFRDVPEMEVILLTYQWDLPMDVSQLQLAVGSLLRKKEQLLAIHPDRVGRSGFTLGGPQASPSWVVRLSSEPYGKHGARRDHVAAEPRPGGNVRNARRGPGAPARVPAARALPSSLSPRPGRTPVPNFVSPDSQGRRF